MVLKLWPLKDVQLPPSSVSVIFNLTPTVSGYRMVEGYIARAQVYTAKHKLLFGMLLSASSKEKL